MTEVVEIPDFIKKLLDATPGPDPDPKKAPKWRNFYRWRHPEASLPRADGLIAPGEEFGTSTLYDSKKEAEDAADAQMFGFEGKCWPPQMRIFLQYLGARPVEAE